MSDVCDAATAKLIAKEVSDGVIAPGYEPEALEILGRKRKGNYNVIEIDVNYVPAALVRKMCFGVTFEQGRNALELNESLLETSSPKTRPCPRRRSATCSSPSAPLKYTQSNSVCYVVGRADHRRGRGASSHAYTAPVWPATRADLWQLSIIQGPRTAVQSRLSRSERDNTIDLYLSNEESGDVLGDEVWQNFFTVRPEPLTAEEKKAYLAGVTGVSLGSDAFFPFGDNIERAHRSGVSYVAQPGGSIRDDHVIDTCNKYGMAMAFTGVRLFHH